MGIAKSKTLLSAEIINILSGMRADVRRKYKADIRGIFGSYAKGANRKDSDLDILVEFDEDANLLDMTGLSIFLEEYLKCRVDIVPESALRDELKEDILKETVYL